MTIFICGEVWIFKIFSVNYCLLLLIWLNLGVELELEVADGVKQQGVIVFKFF